MRVISNMDSLHPFEGVGIDVFDFTLNFEQIILSLVPSSTVLILSLLRLYALKTEEPLGIQGRLLRTAKLVSLHFEMMFQG